MPAPTTEQLLAEVHDPLQTLVDRFYAATTAIRSNGDGTVTLTVDALAWAALTSAASTDPRPARSERITPRGAPGRPGTSHPS